MAKQAKRNSGRSCLGCLVSLLLFLLLLLGAALAVWLYLPHLAQIPLTSLVTIDSPSTDSLADVNQTIVVQMTAIGPQPFRRLELYADGVLFFAQDNGAETPLVASSSFTPLAPGRVVLQARAYDTIGNFTDSAVTFLNVSGESQSLPSPPAGSTNIQLAIVDCDAAQLAWSPVANATGYVIYRLGPGDSYLNRAADLPAGANNYRERIPVLGLYRYQLAAFINGREVLEPMVKATTPPQCVAESQTQTLKLFSLQTNEVYDGVYCYVALNGSSYERVPAGDFTIFTPNADGHTYQLNNYLAVGGLQTFDLKGECWGRRGNEAILLGPFITTIQPNGQPGNTSAELPFQLFYQLEGEPDLSRPEIVHARPNDPHVLPPATELQIRPSLASCTQFSGQPAQNECLIGGLGMAGWPTLFWGWVANPTYSENELTRYEVHLIVNGQPAQLLANITRVGLQPLPRSLILPNTYLPCNTTLEIQVQAIAGSLASVPAGIPWQTTPACP